MVACTFLLGIVFLQSLSLTAKNTAPPFSSPFAAARRLLTFKKKVPDIFVTERKCMFEVELPRRSIAKCAGEAQ